MTDSLIDRILSNLRGLRLGSDRATGFSFDYKTYNNAIDTAVSVTEQIIAEYQTSEIPYNETELHDKISLLLFNSEAESYQEDVTAILDLIRPYLRTTEPVMSEPTSEMLMAGARSIGRTMRVPNHTERARDCWDSMIRAKETGELGEAPMAGG